MDIAKFQLKLADRCYFELLRKCSQNITKAVKSCYPGMQWKFLTPPQDSTNNSPTHFIKLSALTIFCWIKQVPSLIFFKLLTESLFSIRSLLPTTYTKALRAHLANSVGSFQSSWTNGKRFACKHRATRK